MINGWVDLKAVVPIALAIKKEAANLLFIEVMVNSNTNLQQVIT